MPNNNKEDYYVLVAGSRTLNDYETVNKYLDTEISSLGDYNIIIVQGEATGVDLLAKRYAEEKGYTCKCFPAQWAIHGNKAGFIRNEIMHKFISQYPKRVCICFKHCLSHGKGTSHSIELGEKYKTNVIWYDVSPSGLQRTFYNNANEE